MNGLVESLKTYGVIAGLLLNAGALVWTASGRFSTLDTRLADHQRRMDRIEIVLDRLTEQQALLAQNLRALTILVEERTKSYRTD